MKEAGFENGFETSVLVLAGNQDEIGIATALQQMWGADRHQARAPAGRQRHPHRSNTATALHDARSRPGPTTSPIPSEITSYFVYSPTIEALHTGWKNDEADKLFEASQKEIDPTKRADEYAQHPGDLQRRGPIVPLYETPYPVALSKNVKGFVQIPLGNNIFSRAPGIEK